MPATPTAPPGGFQQGGWYDGQQYWNGTFSAPGVENSLSNSPTAGKAVNPTVIAASNAAQGLAPGTNEAYLQGQQTKPTNPVSAPSITPNGAAPSTTNATNGGMAFGGAPTIDINSITQSAYNSPEITDAQKAIDERTAALTKAQTDINDNPFYSEATRTGKLSKLQDQANTDIKIQQDKLASLKADAAIKVQAATNQYNINNEAYKTNLSTFMSLFNAGGLDSASISDLANYAVSTGIPVSILQSLQQKSLSANVSPQLIQSTDPSGNVTITAVDKQTGNILNQVSAGDVGKGFKGSGGTDSPTKMTAAEINATIGNVATDAKKGALLQDLVNHYASAGGLTVDQVYAAYNQNSINGPARESLSQVKQGIYSTQPSKPISGSSVPNTA